QLFYIPVSDQLLQSTPQSLADILSQFDDNPIIKTLPLKSTLHVALSLAQSFLQFHSTPWLPQTWGSRDVLFFVPKDHRQQGLQLESPYLKLELHKTNKGKGKAVETSGCCQGIVNMGEDVGLVSTAAATQQEVLFRFAIVLLEIGFSRPWFALRDLVRNALPPSRQTDYHMAETLSGLLIRQMGPNYVRIIRKCIG
ncbi:hypothetical protein B0T26DRAFT_597781, partial [Lasiosphaeria miniovina]